MKSEISLKRLGAIFALMAAMMFGASAASASVPSEPTAVAGPAMILLAQAAPAADAPAGAPAAEAAAAEPTPQQRRHGLDADLHHARHPDDAARPGAVLRRPGRSKNMLSVLMHVMAIFALITILWAIYGYSLAFSDGGALLRQLRQAVPEGHRPRTRCRARIPEYVVRRVPVHLRGHHLRADRRLVCRADQVLGGAAVLGALVHLAYLPMAHMVWAPPGLLFKDGAIDFAGGTVVHINAGIAGLVGAWVVGRRIGYGREAMAPHSLTFTLIGASLLWVGWFGFNAGSALDRRRRRRPCLHQHHPGNRRGDDRLADRRIHGQGQAFDAGRSLRRGGRPGGGHAGEPASSARWVRS